MREMLDENAVFNSANPKTVHQLVAGDRVKLTDVGFEHLYSLPFVTERGVITGTFVRMGKRTGSVIVLVDTYKSPEPFSPSFWEPAHDKDGDSN